MKFCNAFIASGGPALFDMAVGMLPPGLELYTLNKLVPITAPDSSLTGMNLKPPT